MEACWSREALCWPAWKVLLLVTPLGKLVRSATVELLMLLVEGDTTGTLCGTVLFLKIRHLVHVIKISISVAMHIIVILFSQNGSS